MLLVRTAGVNLTESFALPTADYLLAASFAGRDAGLWVTRS